jgi:L-asparagine transporter-like permease
MLVLINATHVELFGIVEYCFSALKIAAIIIFIVLGIWLVSSTSLKSAQPLDATIGFSNYVAYGGFFPKGLSGMWTAVLVSLFSYFSIEMIAVAAGEAKDPQRAITHAFRATMLRLGLFYICTLALVLAVVPWNVTAASGTQSPFITVMVRTHIPGAAAVVNVVILIAALSAMNSQLYISTRMLFSLSRAGFAPRSLGVLSSKGVPVLALSISTIGIALAAILNLRYHDRSFLMMLAISMFGPMFTWLMIFITHIVFRRRHAKEHLAFRMWGYPFTSIAGAMFMTAALLTTLFTVEFRPTLLYGIPLLTILSVAYALRRRSPAVPAQQAIKEIHPT